MLLLLNNFRAILFESFDDWECGFTGPRLNTCARSSVDCIFLIFSLPYILQSSTQDPLAGQSKDSFSVIKNLS